MNLAQKIILAIGLLLFTVSGLFPSWMTVHQYITGHKQYEARGDWFLLGGGPSSPNYVGENSAQEAYDRTYAQPDYKLLLTRCAIIAVLTAGGMALVHRKQR
jgi:hypothetical protein